MRQRTCSENAQADPGVLRAAEVLRFAQAGGHSPWADFRLPASWSTGRISLLHLLREYDDAIGSNAHVSVEVQPVFGAGIGGRVEALAISETTRNTPLYSRFAVGRQ